MAPALGECTAGTFRVARDWQLCARPQTDLTSSWFADLPFIADIIYKQILIKKNRLLGHEQADVFFAMVVPLAKRYSWISDDQFNVAGTLIKSWGSLKKISAPKVGAHSKDDGGKG